MTTTQLPSETSTQPVSAPDMPPQIELLNVLNGMMSARALQVAAELGVADHLVDGPRPCDELATCTAVRAPNALYRLLRFLASVGIFTEVAPGTFGQTGLSECLRSDVPGSMRDLARMYGSPWRWAGVG